MFNFFLRQTDNFICTNIKTIFESLETNYKEKGLKVDLIQELKNLEFDPFVNINYRSSAFEKNIKLKLKSVIGIFFVLIPLLVMLGASYLMDIPYSYSFLVIFMVAIFGAARTSKVATKYSNFRHTPSLGTC